MRETFLTNFLDEGGGVDLLDVEIIAKSVIDSIINDEIIDDEKKKKFFKNSVSGLEVCWKLEDNLDAKKYVKLWIMFMDSRRASAMNEALMSLQFQLCKSD